MALVAGLEGVVAWPGIESQLHILCSLRACKSLFVSTRERQVYATSAGRVSILGVLAARKMHIRLCVKGTLHIPRRTDIGCTTLDTVRRFGGCGVGR